MKIFITLLPIIFITAVNILTLIFVKRSDIKSLFTEYIPQPDGKEPIAKTSSSRVILFLSGFAAIMIAISILVYYLYMVLNGNAVDTASLNEVMKVMLYLGIGVVPYGANQLKGLF